MYGVEVIEIEQSGGDRQLNIVIAGDAGFDVPYQLTVERLAAMPVSAMSTRGCWVTMT